MCIHETFCSLEEVHLDSKGIKISNSFHVNSLCTLSEVIHVSSLNMVCFVTECIVFMVVDVVGL